MLEKTSSFCKLLIASVQFAFYSQLKAQNMSFRPRSDSSGSTGSHDANWQVPPKDHPHRLKRMESVQIQSFKPTIISDSRRQIEDLSRDLRVNNDHIHVIEQRLRLSLNKGLRKYVGIQLCLMNVVPLLSKPYANKVTLREQK